MGITGILVLVGIGAILLFVHIKIENGKSTNTKLKS